METTTEVEARELPGPALHRQVPRMRRMLSDPVTVLDELSAEYGPVFGLGAGPGRMAVIGDPEVLHEMFSRPTDDFVWNHRMNVLGFVVGGGSMIVSDGEDHVRRRGAVRAAFTRRRLNGWIPMIVERTDRVIDGLIESGGGEREVDLYPVGRSLVLEIVVRAMFGERLAARCEEIGELFQRPQDYLESPAYRQLPHPFPWTRRAKVRADRRALDAIIDEEMAMLRSPTGAVDDPADVLASLVDDGSLTDQEIRDQVVTLMGAGYDTTAASLGWMFWCVSLAPGLWGRLREEADRVFGPLAGESAPPDHTTLASLDLADRTVRETTRLHPAGVLSPREAASDLVIGGYRVPKRTLILWSPHLAGRDPAAWDDPLRFDPDRFIDLDDERKRLADMAWVPFGRGARNCIGFALARIELTLIISRVAQRLDVTALHDTEPQPVGMVVNRPTGGAPMLVAARDA